MTLYLLDTNIASHVMRGDIPAVRQRLASVSAHAVALSAMTEAELRYGVAKRGHSRKLAVEVDIFLSRFAILPWPRLAARAYAELRWVREVAGKPLSAIDLLIASHAKAIGATLVTRDASFALMPCGLALENWAALP